MHGRVRTIRKNIDTYDIPDSWKRLLSKQKATTATVAISKPKNGSFF